MYDDKEQTIKEISDMDLTPSAGKYVKVVVINKTNQYFV
jgi:hypothetical protein